ncbi:MAG: hypothetical protein KJ063_25440 [Anaerolineae bacterium]|nr:hypothetical protein [Anaerolineae bacterium]
MGYTQIQTNLFFNGLVPKIGYFNEVSILEKIWRQTRPLGAYESSHFTHPIYAHRIVAHFVKSFDFIPYFWNEKDGLKKSEDYKVFQFNTKKEALLANAALNSNTFYYFYLLYSDAYHCGRELILSFPFDLKHVADDQVEILVRLNEDLMLDMQSNSARREIEYRTGQIKYDEFYPRLSKPFIDKIDRVLAQHYGLTDEELDFIINYDIKYRLGDDLFTDDNEP